MSQTYFERQLKDVGFSDYEIKIIKEIIENTCNHCWDNDDSCQCCNDE